MKFLPFVSSKLAIGMHRRLYADSESSGGDPVRRFYCCVLRAPLTGHAGGRTLVWRGALALHIHYRRRQTARGPNFRRQFFIRQPT